MAEIEKLVSDYGVKVCLFSDDEFFGRAAAGRKRVWKIAALLREKKLGIRFWAMFRVDDIVNSKGDELLEHFKEAGLCGAFLGVETGSVKQLKDYHKGTTVAQNIEAIHLLKKHNIIPEIGMMMFYPVSDFEGLRESADFLLKTGEAAIFRYFASKLALYPGENRFLHKFREAGLLLPAYNYRNEYAYRFANPEVARLFVKVEDLAKKLQQLDVMICNFRKVRQILTDLLAGSRGFPKDKNTDILTDLRFQLEKAEDKIAGLNQEVFLKLLTAAEEGRPENAFTKISTDYLSAIYTETKKFSRMSGEMQVLKQYANSDTDAYFISRFLDIKNQFDLGDLHGK